MIRCGLLPPQAMMVGVYRGRTAGYPHRPLTDPGVRFSRTGLFATAHSRIETGLRTSWSGGALGVP